MTTNDIDARTIAADTVLCIRCTTTPAAGFCCKAHGKQLCHLCYRKTHFVEVCASRCSECAAENLPAKLRDLASGVSR